MSARMTAAGLVRHRWRAQGFAGPLGTTPEEVVGRLGAVQAENYPLAKWAIALRARRVDERAIERAVADGTILRTHVLRPTWHFVRARDLRWMLRLTAHRLHAGTARRGRWLGLDAKLIARSHRVIGRALEAGHLTRAELGDRLARTGIVARGPRLAHILGDAEFEGLICSGVPRGTSQTYALLAERAPANEPLDGDAALAELARRYFTTRGPATELDFRWWSNLKAADARTAIEAARPWLESVRFGDRTYWRAPETALPARRRSPGLLLLHTLDEYVVAYTQSRDLILDDASARLMRLQDVRLHPVVRSGKVAGFWRRQDRAGALSVTVWGSTKPGRAERVELERAAARHGRFFDAPIEIELRASRLEHA